VRPFAKCLRVFGLVLAFAVGFDYERTPQTAALQAVRYPGHVAAKIARTVIVGNYATVLLHAAIVESAPLTNAILLQKFSFGWQLLDIVDSACVFRARRIARNTTELLMRRMPRVNSPTSCKGYYGTDYRARREVAAVREFARGPFVPFAAVYRDWAKSDWYGAGGGEAFYHLRNGRWRVAFGGGGAYSTEELRKCGVPKAAWCPFRVHGTKCR